MELVWKYIPPNGRERKWRFCRFSPYEQRIVANLREFENARKSAFTRQGPLVRSQYHPPDILPLSAADTGSSESLPAGVIEVPAVAVQARDDLARAGGRGDLSVLALHGVRARDDAGEDHVQILVRPGLEFAVRHNVGDLLFDLRAERCVIFLREFALAEARLASGDQIANFAHPLAQGLIRRPLLAVIEFEPMGRAARMLVLVRLRLRRLNEQGEHEKRRGRQDASAVDWIDTHGWPPRGRG